MVPCGHQPPKVMTSRHGSLRNPPPETKHGHEDAMRDFDNQKRRERLPCQLRNWRNRPDQRVLVAREMCVVFHAERRAEPQHRLVEDLQEVHPYEDQEDDSVGFASDAFAVVFAEGDSHEAGGIDIRRFQPWG